MHKDRVFTDEKALTLELYKQYHRKWEKCEIQEEELLSLLPK